MLAKTWRMSGNPDRQGNIIPMAWPHFDSGIEYILHQWPNSLPLTMQTNFRPRPRLFAREAEPGIHPQGGASARKLSRCPALEGFTASTKPAEYKAKEKGTGPKVQAANG